MSDLDKDFEKALENIRKDVEENPENWQLNNDHSYRGIINLYNELEIFTRVLDFPERDVWISRIYHNRKSIEVNKEYALGLYETVRSEQIKRGLERIDQRKKLEEIDVREVVVKFFGDKDV